MNKSVKKIALKTLKLTGIIFGILLLIIILIPLLFPGAVNQKINAWANQNINGNISFSSTRLSFFRRFPALTLSLKDVVLKGSAPFEKDTLIAAKEIGFGIDVSSLFKKKITINKVFLDEAFINIQADSLGHANYNIVKPSSTTAAAADTSAGASLGINQILITRSRLVYNDQSLPMTINARGFNYSGSGDLSKDIFDLKTHTDIESIDFYYGRQPYVIGKKVNADLVTQINTKSLAFIFEKNTLMINQLPVEFNGRFGFIKDGYDMNFNIDSHENDIDVILSALPADIQKLFEKTELNGIGNIQIALAGKFVAKDSLAPDLSMNVKIRNGYIANDKSPSPVKNLYLDFSAKLPKLNPDSMSVNVDSLYFNIADGYLSSEIHVRGLKTPEVSARINSEIDLEKWDNAIGLKPFHVKGKYALHLSADGRYATTVTNNPKTKKPDTVITSIPNFTLASSFTNGYFKYNKLPEAIDHIHFNMSAGCTDNNFRHIKLTVDSLNISALKNYIRGSFRLSNLDDYMMDASIQASVHLDDLKKLYPIDSLDLKGDLLGDVKAKGSYLPAKKKYPKVDANVTLQNGFVQTKYYPHPIGNIQVNTTISDKTGDLKGLSVSVQPLTFNFENEPFTLKADLRDFTNLDYKINVQGVLDLGKIYQVFAVKGYNVTGTISANLTMKGRQNDATGGHYDKLFNKGSLRIKDVYCSADMYPKPFYIPRGVFSFRQDKMQLDTFVARYANSTFIIDGTVSNVIDYIMKPGSVLKGDFKLRSDLIVVDDFMLVTDTTKPKPDAVKPNTSAPAETGVVIVPKNLDLTFTADVKKIKYTDILLTDAWGNLSIKNGVLAFKETGFTIIDAPVTMDGDYTILTPKKAKFNYHIIANKFDVHKAYTKIKMFHDLATSAAGAEGLISLDYKLGGSLNAGMAPIFPSLKGGGVLTADKIKMKGFKLFSAIGKETGKDSLGSNSDVSRVNIKSSIANNIITIEPTKIRMAVFRARFGGQVSFSNELNLKFRLGLPPMGIIGIPMTITGTEDKPKIHLGKGKQDDELEGVTDTDD